MYAAATTAHDVGMSPVPVAPFAPLRFAVAYVGAVFVAGVVLGVLRTLWLAPAVGPVAAEVGVSLLAGRDLAAHGALYRTAEAQLGLAGQVVFGLLPAVFAGRKIR